MVKKWCESWIVDFYLADGNGKPIGERLETVDVDRVYAPTRWASNHARMVRRKHRGAAVTFSIEKIG